MASVLSTGSVLAMNKKTYYFMALLWAYYTWLREHNNLPFQEDLKGKHIYLTGAGSGLGRLLALKLAKQGAKLTLSDINE